MHPGWHFIKALSHDLYCFLVRVRQSQGTSMWKSFDIPGYLEYLILHFVVSQGHPALQHLFALVWA